MFWMLPIMAMDKFPSRIQLIKNGSIHCTLVNGKARVAPLTFMTIFRKDQHYQ